MTKSLRGSEPLSSLALNVAIFSLVFAVLCGIGEGYVRGILAYSIADSRTFTPGAVSMLASWCFSFRNIAENVLYAAALVFAAAKFLEGRTLLTVGFEKLDADKISIREPDENNIVWIGQRYGTKLEADSVFATLENRLQEGLKS
jgi:hypothetical protein